MPLSTGHNIWQRLMVRMVWIHTTIIGCRFVLEQTRPILSAAAAVETYTRQV